MVRSYAEDPVDAAVVDRALRNATRAPSAGFSQGWGFVVLDSAHALRHKLPFRATLGNRWTRIGSYIAFVSALVLPLVIPMARS